MVESPNKTHSSEMGWRHFLAASSWSWVCNWPREGGAAKSGPMTLNRKWAQRSCGRKIDDVSFTGCHYFIFSTHSVVWPRFYTSPPTGVARHPVRAKDTPSHRPPQGNRLGGDR